MSDVSIIKQWNIFAKSIGGIVDKSNANYLDHDNFFKISTDKTDVELVWGNEPQHGRGVFVTLESKFRYKLSPTNFATMKVQPTDFFSKLFTANKQKFGVKDLDNSYGFSSNSDSLAFQLSEIFKEFHNFNHYKNFIIETEEISGVPNLIVFIPELITTKNDLSLYYNFGLRIAAILSNDIK